MGMARMVRRFPVTSVARSNGEPQRVTVHAEYQGCQDNGLCYPVMQKDIVVELPAASAEQLAAANASFVAPSEPGAACT